MHNSLSTIAPFDATIKELIRLYGNPGLSLAITDQKQTLYSQAYGYANLDAKTPMQTSHVMEIGSIGKSFTSIVIQQLHEQGLIDIHKPVQDYLDWFSVQSDYAPITIHHLLSHTAGIITGMDQSGGAFYDVYALRDTRTSCAPGSHFHYSNVGYKTLGLLIEHILQKPYAQIIQERILNPLGMTQTYAAITHDTRKKMALGYVPLYDDRPASYPPQWVEATWIETMTADGCIASTVEDMTRYMRLYLNHGYEGVLSSSGFERMTTPVIETEPDNYYGHGIDISSGNGQYILGHGGGMVGYTTLMRIDMNARLGVMAMINQSEVETPLDEIVDYTLNYFAAERSQAKTAVLSPIQDMYAITHALDYVGTFIHSEQKLIFTARGDKLILHYGSESIPLIKRQKDHFYVDHEDFRLFLLIFERENDAIVGVSCGGRFYRRASQPAPDASDYPAEWDAFVGHFRCHNPWYSNVRIILKRGQLYLVYNSGTMEILRPLGHNRFRVGDEQSPEFIEFDLYQSGLCQRINYSGLEMYRFFTP